MTVDGISGWWVAWVPAPAYCFGPTSNQKWGLISYCMPFDPEGCHESVVRLLLDKGAEVNAGNNNGRTPLYLASYSGHESVVRLLRDRGGR